MLTETFITNVIILLKLSGTKTSEVFHKRKLMLFTVIFKKNCCDIFGGRGVENNKCYDMIYD